MAKRTKRLTSQEEDLNEIRINKYLSEAGICSRREADRYITEGKVKIDGVVAQMGSKVTPGSQVTYCDNPVKREEKLVLIAFNKPEGIVCTTDQTDPDNIIDYINYGMRIYPIGRLDKDSEGLILLTNDGNIVNKILRAENKHEKEYVVTVNKDINAEFIQNMSSGVPILDTVTNPCTVTLIDKYTFNIVLTQGLNRQIRRMCEYLGYRVINLRRIRIMNIQLGRLKPGDFRNVTEKEIEELNKSFQLQHSTHTVKRTEADNRKVGNNKVSNNKVSNNKVKYRDINSIKSNKVESRSTENILSTSINQNSNIVKAQSSYVKGDNEKSNNEKSNYEKRINAKSNGVKSHSVMSNEKSNEKSNGKSREKSNNGKSDNGKSDNGKSDNGKSDNGKSDNGKSNNGKSNYVKNNNDESNNVKSNYVKSRNIKSNGKSNNGKSNNGKSNNEKSNYVKSDSRKSNYAKNNYTKS